MQIALPRTHDAGKIQEQLNQRGQISQDQLANSLQKQVELQRTQVQENDESAKLLLKKEQSNHQNKDERRNKEDQREEENPDHPYKGKNIDFFG